MYNIGQIIYIFKESNDSLFPCVVCEEVVKKTLEGTVTSYKVLLPDTEGTVVELLKMDVKIFKSLEDFKSQYVLNAKTRADSSIKKCKEISVEKFKKFAKENSVDTKSNKDSEKIIIKDENNMKLNIDMSKLEELGIWTSKVFI